MTKLITSSQLISVHEPKVGAYIDRNHRKTTNKKVTDTRTTYLNLHELSIGTTVNYTVPLDGNDYERCVIQLRNAISQYSIYVGIYCNVKITLDKYTGNINFAITHDGIRYK